MVLRAPSGAGIHAPEHHSESTETLFAHIPGLRVVIPSSPARAYGLLLAAIRDPDPVVFLEPTRLYRLFKEVRARQRRGAAARRVLPAARRHRRDARELGRDARETLAAATRSRTSGIKRGGHRRRDAGAARHAHDPRVRRRRPAVASSCTRPRATSASARRSPRSSRTRGCSRCSHRSSGSRATTRSCRSESSSTPTCPRRRTHRRRGPRRAGSRMKRLQAAGPRRRSARSRNLRLARRARTTTSSRSAAARGRDGESHRRDSEPARGKIKRLMARPATSCKSARRSWSSWAAPNTGRGRPRPTLEPSSAASTKSDEVRESAPLGGRRRRRRRSRPRRPPSGRSRAALERRPRDRDADRAERHDDREDIERVARILTELGPLEMLRGVRRTMARSMAQAHAEVAPVTVKRRRRPRRVVGATSEC